MYYRLIERLRGRRDMNFRSGNMEKAMAYCVAIADTVEIMSIGKLLSISENIKMPAKLGDIGHNLIMTEECVIKTDEVCNVPTGVKVKLPTGYWGLILARSSTVFKHHIHVFPGVIDNGYIGELFVPCIAMTKQRIISAGSSIAQLILFPSVTPEIELVKELPKTDRGESGFGSTGI